MRQKKKKSKTKEEEQEHQEQIIEKTEAFLQITKCARIGSCALLSEHSVHSDCVYAKGLFLSVSIFDIPPAFFLYLTVWFRLFRAAKGMNQLGSPPYISSLRKPNFSQLQPRTQRRLIPGRNVQTREGR